MAGRAEQRRREAHLATKNATIADLERRLAAAEETAQRVPGLEAAIKHVWYLAYGGPEMPAPPEVAMHVEQVWGDKMDEATARIRSQRLRTEAAERDLTATRNEAEMWHMLADMVSIEHECCHDEAAHYRREELESATRAAERERDAAKAIVAEYEQLGAQTGREFVAQIEALETERDSLRAALQGLVAHEDQPCRFDHHGYCQEHFVTMPCTVAVGRALLGLPASALRGAPAEGGEVGA